MQESIIPSWRQTFRYLLYPFLAMVIGLLLTLLVIASNPSLYIFRLPNATTLYENLVTVILIGIVGGIATVAAFRIFQRGGETLSRFVVTIFLSPVFFLLTVFIGETILLLLIFGGLTNLHYALLAMVSIFFVLFAILFIFTDALTPRVRNIIFASYGLILGVFLGTSFSWFSALAILTVVAVEDTLFATRLGPTVIEADPKQHIRSAFVFSVGPMIIGIGDLVVYAALVSYAQRFFSIIISLLTLIMILVGCFINVLIVSRYPNKVIPGVPVPLLLAFIPISISLAQITWLGLMIGLL